MYVVSAIVYDLKVNDKIDINKSNIFVLLFLLISLDYIVSIVLIFISKAVLIDIEIYAYLLVWTMK